MSGGLLFSRLLIAWWAIVLRCLGGFCPMGYYLLLPCRLLCPWAIVCGLFFGGVYPGIVLWSIVRWAIVRVSPCMP